MHEENASSKKGDLWIFFYIVAKFLQSKNKNIAILLIFCLICLNLFAVATLFYWSQWISRFFNIIQSYDLSSFPYLISLFCLITTCYITFTTLEFYLRNVLEIKWRTWLTNYFISEWLFSKAYYKSNFMQKSDDAEQKISEDIRDFVSLSINLSFDSFNAIFSIVVFSNLLWNLSGTLSFFILNHRVIIYGYLVWSALGYATLGSIFMTIIGKPLSQLNKEKKSTESEFRFRLSRVKEYNESIILFNGEQLEHKTVMIEFENIAKNFISLARLQLKLRLFKATYNQIGSIFPLLIAIPMFFTKQILLGGLMQIRSSFEEVKLSLFYFINTFDNFYLLRAVAVRLYELEKFIFQYQAILTQPQVHSKLENTYLSLENLSIYLPNGMLIIDNLTFNLDKGNRLFIDGASGSGKTIMIKSLVGVWPYKSGIISQKLGLRTLVISQKTYLPFGSLKQAICYPLLELPNDSIVIEIMAKCRISYLNEKLHLQEKWDKILSLGEQQRIAICRALIYMPDILYLDEATSALDSATEEIMYKLLIKKFSHSVLISISHKPNIKQWHNKFFNLEKSL